MAVFRELTITWKGKDYKFTPSMRLMRSIEDEISIASLTTRAAEGDLPISHANFVITKMLQAAGVTVTEEDVWFEINAMGNDGMIAMIRTALSAFAPPETQGKNPDAQTESPS